MESLVTCIPDVFPPKPVVRGNTQRATDIPEAFLLYMERDVDLVVILVDFVEKRLHARKLSRVDATSRMADLPTEKVVRLFVECSTTIDESRA